MCMACQSTTQQSSIDVPQDTPPRPVFLRIRPNATDAEPAALTHGVIIVRDGCIRLVDASNPQGLALIWNVQFTFDGTTITDTLTHQQTRIGDEVMLGGGLAGNDYLALLDDPTANPCTPPYWFAAAIPK